jgi:hypothetical protein
MALQSASWLDGAYITGDISASEFAAIAQQRETQTDDDAYRRHGLNLQSRTREC